MTKKGVKEEALESLKAMQSAKLEPETPPSPLQALWGGLTAGAIAILLYKFTTTIEGALNRQTISDNFSVCYVFVDLPLLACTLLGTSSDFSFISLSVRIN